MTAGPGLPRRPLTHRDLEDMPEDGHRYELIDGTLLVTPAPMLRHQRAVVRLCCLLDPALPRELEVLVAPFDVVLGDDTLVQPDVLVARREDLGEGGLGAAPVLVVEVLSPSTRSVDLLLKRERYERAGVVSYWVVDPDRPSLTCFELGADGRYRESGQADGDAVLTVSVPATLDLVPRDLVR